MQKSIQSPPTPATFDRKDKTSKRLQGSLKGLETAFVREFSDISDKQVDLLEVYGVNLVAEYLGVDVKLIHLQEKDVIANTLGGVYNFKVYRGKRKVIGMLSIQLVRGLLGKTKVVFIFRVKNSV
jgi:hypothetical protein